jgi:hypothetical protein
MQYLSLIAVLGPQRNAAASVDPVLRFALDIPDGVGAHLISEWSQSIGTHTARRSMQVMAEHLYRRGKVSGAVTLAPMGEGVVAVDGARGIWLGTAPADPGSILSLVASIDAALGRPAAIAASEPWIEACLESGRRQPTPIDERFLGRLDEQRQHVSVGAPFDLRPAMSEILRITAHTLGRELAWRLPGFSSSSLRYLWDNFLSFTADVSIKPNQIVVHVGDPPLHLVLSLAGMNRRRFLFEATGNREWVLTQRR